MLRILCLFGLHAWHPSVPIFEQRRISKLICTRCWRRKWWRA